MMKNYSEQLKQVLEKYNNILICIKGSPDPDAIASSFALKCICETLNVRSLIVATTKLSLPQNKAFVNKLKIPVRFHDTLPNIDKFDSYIVADHQSAFIEGITGKLPCAAHIDHHEKIDEDIEADFKLIREDVGSASTIITLLLKEMDIKIEDYTITYVSTALLYGIQTDTDKYKHATSHDYEALNFLSKYSDNRIINKITGLPLSENTAKYLREAVLNQTVYKNWLITGIGFINETDRDSIAIIADFLLAREKAPVVIVFAAIQKKGKDRLALDVSLRTDVDDIDLNNIIKGITPNGGARNFKGAYQIDLNYFDRCPDKEKLWEVIHSTTVEILKKQRDELLITDLRGFYRKLRSRVSSVFKK